MAFTVLFAALCLALWLLHNKFTIERKSPSQPADCIFKILILWRSMFKYVTMSVMDKMVAMIKSLFSSTFIAPSATRIASALSVAVVSASLACVPW